MRIRRTEDGASLVEFALLLPVLVLILFGIVDFGSLYNNYQSVRQGARDGMRQAVVLGTAPISASAGSCTPQGGNVPASGMAHDLICYTKNRVGLSDIANVRVRIIWNAVNASDTTNTGVFPSFNPVMVCVQYKASSLSGLTAPFINGKILNTQAESLIENGTNDATMKAAVSGTFGDLHEDSLNNNTAGWPTTCATSNL